MVLGSTAPYDRIWAIAVAEGDAGKVVFVGRESGVLEKFSATTLTKGSRGGRGPSLSLPGIHTAAITGIAAGSADEVMTVSLDSTMRTWNTAVEVEGKRAGKPVALPGPARCLFPSPDGGSTYCGLSSGVIAKLDGNTVASTLTGHTDAVVALASSAEGTPLFSASYDRTIRAWDPASGATLFIFETHTSHVKGLAVVNNGAQLVSCGRDDRLLVWNVPAEGAGGDQDEPATGGGDAGAEEGGEEGGDGETKAPVAAAEPQLPKVFAAGVLELPSTPHCLTTIGSQLVVGGADGSVLGFTTKQLLKAVADYSATVSRSCSAAARSIEKAAAVRVTNVHRRAKKVMKETRAALVAEEITAKEAEAARRKEELAQKKARAADGTAENAGDEPDEGDAEAEEGTGDAPPPPMSGGEGEPEDGEEGGDGEEDGDAAVALTGARAERLAAAKAEREAAVAAELAEVQAEKARALSGLGPAKDQKFTFASSKLDTCPFATVFRRSAEEPSQIIVADGGSTLLVGAGCAVVPVECRVNVKSL